MTKFSKINYLNRNIILSAFFLLFLVGGGMYLHKRFYEGFKNNYNLPNHAKLYPDINILFRELRLANGIISLAMESTENAYTNPLNNTTNPDRIVQLKYIHDIKPHINPQLNIASIAINSALDSIIKFLPPPLPAMKPPAPSPAMKPPAPSPAMNNNTLKINPDAAVLNWSNNPTPAPAPAPSSGNEYVTIVKTA